MEKEQITKLVIDWKNGDESAYEALYKEFYNPMLRIALKNTQAFGKTNMSDAEDVVQNAMMKAYKSIGSLENPERFSSWLTTIVVNQARDYMTSAVKKNNVLFSDQKQENDEGKETDIEDLTEDKKDSYRPDIQMDNRVREEILSEILNNLTEEQRIVAVMFYYDEMSMKEIAEELGVEMSTVVGRLQTAKKNIKAEVTAIQKRDDIKLYNISAIPAIPFFLWLLGRASTEANAVTSGTSATVATVAGAEAVKKVASSTADTATKATADTAKTTAKTVTSKASNTSKVSSIGKTAKAAGTSMTKKIVAGAVAVGVIGGGAAIGISKANAKTFDALGSGTVITFDGADGYGTFDSKVSVDLSGNKVYQGMPDELKEAIAYVLDDKDVVHGLSNGDTYTIKCVYVEPIFEKYKYKIKDTSKEIKVTGLKKVVTKKIWDEKFEWVLNEKDKKYELKIDSKDKAYKDLKFKAVQTDNYDDDKSEVSIVGYESQDDYDKFGFLPVDDDGNLAFSETINVSPEPLYHPDVPTSIADLGDDLHTRLANLIDNYCTNAVSKYNYGSDFKPIAEFYNYNGGNPKLYFGEKAESYSEIKSYKDLDISYNTNISGIYNAYGRVYSYEMNGYICYTYAIVYDFFNGDGFTDDEILDKGYFYGTYATPSFSDDDISRVKDMASDDGMFFQSDIYFGCDNYKNISEWVDLN